MGRKAREGWDRSKMVQKRFYISKETAAMLGIMRVLMADESDTKTYDQMVEMFLLYGMAYVNDTYKLNTNNWLGEVRLPAIQDVKELYGE